MRRPRVPLLLISVIVGAVIAAPRAQNPPQAGENPRTALLMGVIIDPLDGQPVPSAEVRLGGAPAATPNTVVLTDDEGRFVFLGLPKGSFTITATKSGYAEGAYGRLRPSGLPQALPLGDGERVGDLKIAIWKLAVVTGRVTDEAGEPVVGVAVQALQRTVVAGREKLAPGAVARTDDRGIYRIPSLVPGEYAIAVPSTQTSAPDSIIDRYLQRLLTGARPGEPEYDLFRDLSLNGAMDTLNVVQRFRDARIGSQSFASIGAGGRAAVAPARPSGGRIYVYPTSYYPAAGTSSAATRIQLRSGEERTAIDMQLALTATSTVSGTVKGPDGPLIAAMSLVPDTDDLSSDTGFETARSMSDATGKFAFIGVPEGRYQLRAVLAQVPPIAGASRGAPPPPPQALAAPTRPPAPVLGGFTLTATQAITVGSSDMNELAITLRPGFRIGGRAEFIGTLAQPAEDRVRAMSATFDAADARPLVSTIIGRGQFDERGRLSSYQLPPGRYYVRINNAPAGWVLKSATIGGRDVSNVPLSLDADVTALVVTFTDRPSSLSGQVLDASGAADGAATVLIFPSDSAAWTDTGGFPRRLRAVRVDRNGQYQAANLPAGEYLLVAVPDESSANWQDSKVLTSLARVATRAALGDGETRSIPLRTSAVRR